MNIDKWLPLVITYVPTLVFILIIVIYTFLGYARGLRKSVTFLIYSLISLILMVILYAVLTNTDFFNYKFVSIINNINGPYWLQNSLGVNINRDNLTDILTEYVLKNSEQSILEIALYSHAYIVALVQALIRLIVAICLLIIFFILKIFNYILYLIFNKESRRIKKINARYAEGLEPYPYRYKRGYGLALGMIRGLASALVIFAVIGSPLYLVYYNQSYLDEINIEDSDETVQNSQFVLKELSKYGNSGIYKILNTVKNENDVPYYLFITDIVMQGKINDENTSYSKNVYFYTELIKYRKFIDDSFDLILKYDTESLIINDINQSKTDNIYNDLLKIFALEDFQDEFKVLFEHFDKNTYLIDLTYSVLDGIVNNIDQLNFGNEEVEDLLKIMFKKGYKSQYIAYEKKLNSNTILPYISVRDLIPYNDISKVLGLYFSYVKAFEENSSKDENFVLDMISNMSTDLKYFSVVNSTDDNINKVFRRVYAFVSNVYLNNTADEKLETCIYDSKYDNVSWAQETKTLCDSIPSLINIYRTKLKDIDIDKCDFLNLIYKFNESDVSSDYQNVREALMTSNVLEVVINSGFISSMLKESLNNTFKDFAYPTLVDSKETFIIIDALITSEDKKNSLDYIIHNNLNESNYDEYVKNYNIVFDSNLKEKCALSNLFRSLVTSIISENVSEYIYLDDSVKEVENETIVNRINQEDCKAFLNNSNRLFELVQPFIINDNDYSVIDNSIRSLELQEIISDSKIIEGSISKMLFESSDFNFEVPEDLIYVSTIERKSELKKLISSIQILDLSIKELQQTNFDNVYETVKQKNSEELGIVFDSDVIYLNVAKYIYDNESKLLKDVVIPNTCLDTTYTNYIKKDVIIGLVCDVLDLYDETLETNELVNRLSSHKEIFKESSAKDIINATVAYKIVDSVSSTNIDLSLKMKEDGTLENLKSSYDSNNVWYDEIYYILVGLDQFKKSDDLVNIDTISDDILENFSSLNEASTIENKTILNVLYESKLLKYNITTNTLDKLSSSIDSAILNSSFIAQVDSIINDNVIDETELSKAINVLNILDLDINKNINLDVAKLNENYQYWEGDRLISKKKSEIVCESKIARAIGSKTIKEELDKNNIDTPNKALEYVDSKYINVYLENEVITLSLFINNYDVSNVNNIKISNLIDILYDGTDVRSYVILNEISNEILDIENVVVTSDEYSSIDNMMTSIAVYNILISFTEFGVEYISNNVFDNCVLTSQNLNYAYKSNTILATISKTLQIDFAGTTQDICVFSENAVSTQDYKSNDIYIMSSSELKACITELNKLGATRINSTISEGNISQYLLSDSADLESSDIIHIAISNVISNNKFIYNYVSSIYTERTVKSCTNLYNNKVQDKVIYSKN